LGPAYASGNEKLGVLRHVSFFRSLHSIGWVDSPIPFLTIGWPLNRLSLIGRLTRDPELRRTSNGTAVTNFRIANNGTDGVEFNTVVVWRRIA